MADDNGEFIETLKNAFAASQPQEQSETAPVEVPPVETTEPSAIQPIASPTSPAPPVSEPPTFDETSWFKEKSGGKFEKWEQVQELLSKEPEVKPFEFANDVSKQLHEALLSGNVSEVRDYLVKQNFANSIKDKSPEEKIKEHIKMQFPNFDNEDVEIEFASRYTVDELAFEDEKRLKIEKKKAETLMAKDALEAEKYFTQYTQEIKLPSIKQHEAAPASAAPQVDMTSEQAKNAISFSNSLNQSLPKDVFNIPYEITDPSIQLNLKGQVVIPKEQLQAIKSNLIGQEDKFLMSRWFSNNDEPNNDLIARDIYLMTHGEDLIKAAVSDAYHQTRIQMLAERKNHQLPGQEPSGDIGLTDLQRNILGFEKALGL